MYEDAFEVFNFLPLNKSLVEEEYVNHLWEAFYTLSQSNNSGYSFAIMPFHLLFMLSLQYKVLRIYKEKPKKYALVFTISQIRENEKIKNPKSVFDIALLKERSMADLFSILKVDIEIIRSIKTTIDKRNDRLAHAKGGIERNLERSIEEYLSILRGLQKYLLPLNEMVFKRWMKEMKSGQEGVEYVNIHMGEEYLCTEDMQLGGLSKLDKKLNGEQ